MDIPVIETERLRLRPHRPDDLPHCADMWGDALVTRYLGGRPLSEEEVWRRLLCYAGHWEWMGFGYWAVEEKVSGELLGDLGFADYQREFQPSIRGVPELGWVLAGRAQGRGYATEAARAALGWGERHFGPVRTVCIIHPENQASIRVAEKCGYREVQRTAYKGQPAILFDR